jgi:hypothetical protein
MIENENIYDKIQELLGNVKGQLSILEDQIDLDVQMEYYNCSKKVSSESKPDDIIKIKDAIFQADLPFEDQKNLLVRLAAIDDIKAYRILEKYVKEPHPGLREWAYLALQESRMLIESKILDENQILISTGLGGKGLKLRYFTALISSDKCPFTSLQQKIIREEVEFFLEESGGELEDISFDKEICSLISIIPLKIPVQTLFNRVIKECNILGDFIRPDFVINNVKILTSREIRVCIR